MPGKIAGAYWTDVAKYLREPRQGGALHPAFFIVLALVFSAARRKIAVWEKSGADASSAILVFEGPYAAALATTLVIGDRAFIFSVAHRGATIADNRNRWCRCSAWRGR